MKSWPPPLTGDDICWATDGKWNYICCATHVGLVREHGLNQALGLLKHANPSGHAT